MQKLLINAALVVAAGLSMVVPATAETWQARNQNILDKSPQSCAGFEDRQIYTFVLDGDSFSASGATGKYFTIKVPADGNINHEFNSSTGRFAIVGNVTSHALEFHNLRSSCKSKLVPMQ